MRTMMIETSRRGFFGRATAAIGALIFGRGILVEADGGAELPPVSDPTGYEAHLAHSVKRIQDLARRGIGRDIGPVYPDAQLK